jgi:hypothetical protein
LRLKGSLGGMHVSADLRNEAAISADAIDELLPTARLRQCPHDWQHFHGLKFRAEVRRHGSSGWDCLRSERAAEEI